MQNYNPITDKFDTGNIMREAHARISMFKGSNYALRLKMSLIVVWNAAQSERELNRLTPADRIKLAAKWREQMNLQRNVA